MVWKFPRFFVALLIFVTASNYAEAQNCRGCSTWTEGKQLSWEAFRSAPEAGSRMLHHYVIELSYNYQKEKGDTYTFDVHCNFKCAESWCRKERVRPYMLEHIQGNFNIGEIYARRLKKELTAISQQPGFSKKEIKHLYRKIEAERTSFMLTYDLETNQGYYFKDQEEWNQKLAAMLGDLSSFASK